MATTIEAIERKNIFNGPYAASEVFGRAPDVPVYLAKFRANNQTDNPETYVVAFDNPLDKDSLTNTLSDEWGFPASSPDEILDQWDSYTRRKVRSRLFTRKSWRGALIDLDERHTVLPDLLRSDQSRLESELKRLIHFYDPNVNPQVKREDALFLLRRRTPAACSFLADLRDFLEFEDPRFSAEINFNFKARRDRKFKNLLVGKNRQEIFDNFFDSEYPPRNKRLEDYFNARYNWQKATINLNGDQVFIDRSRYRATIWTVSPNSEGGTLYINLGQKYKVTGDVDVIPLVQAGSSTKRADFKVIEVASSENVFPLLTWQNNGEQRSISTDFCNYTLSKVLADQFGERLPEGLSYDTTRAFDTLLGAVDFARSSNVIPRDGELHTYGNPALVPMYVHSRLKQLSTDERLEQAEKFMSGLNFA